MTTQSLIIATRESPLALWQAACIKKALLTAHPHLEISLLGLTTTGDQRLDVSLYEIGGKGLFVKELEEALLQGRAHIAVHSMKDVPMHLPDGLIIPSIAEREDPRDVLVSKKYASIHALPWGAVVGTSSLRRQTQLRAHRADLILKPLRGNIHTRLTKLDQNEFDAIILAAAGLIRMNLQARIGDYLPIDYSLPAAGQGALGIECLAHDQATIALIESINDVDTNVCVSAERAMCRRLGGGCKVPIAAYATLDGDRLTLRGLVANQDGSVLLRVIKSGKRDQAEAIGLDAAHTLIADGALDLLKEFDA